MEDQIFTDISNLITTIEFDKAQEDFFEKNKDKFEDTEENKLEYTNIYTDYVYILEELIEINLKGKYADDQIEAFYGSFADKIGDYKKINPSVVDALFDFIDFEKFKKSMIAHKNRMNEGFSKVETTATGMVDRDINTER